MQIAAVKENSANLNIQRSNLVFFISNYVIF